MVKARDICGYINELAPFDTAMDFDNVGLLVGSGECESGLVLTALDATPAVIDEAVQLGAKIIVTHHPVIFDPLKRLDDHSVVYKAAQKGITIISAHTNLDIAKGGVNETLAKAVGVNIKESFPEDCALIGDLPEPMSCRALADSIRTSLDLPGLRYTDTDKQLRTALVSCGAGGHNIFLAKKCGADAFITGEIKHHEIIFANSNRIAVFDLGHFGSEDVIIPKLTDLLAARFTDIRFRQAQSDTDGVRFLTKN